jgi:hypothetical protein
MKNFVIATVSAVALLGTAAYAEENSATMMKEVTPAHQKAGENCPPHHKKKHHTNKHRKHHKHHVHRGHRGGPLAVRVHFPPVNVGAFSACPCEYYQGNQEARYVYHEGYYWYPQMRADLWMGYQPVQMHGFHWYPSILHPHAVYVEKQSPLHPNLYPVDGEIGMGRGAMHHRHHRHHGKRHHMHHVKHHAEKHNAQPMHQKEMSQPEAHPANPGM